MKLRLIIIFITLSTQLFATSMMKTAREDELKVNLSERGYHTLKAALINSPGVEITERTDVYFDIYQRPYYALKALNEPVKLRFMAASRETKWQIQKTIGSGLFAPFTHKTTLTNEVVVAPGLAENLITKYLSEREQIDTEALKTARELLKILNSEKLIQASASLCNICSIDQLYVPTHQNRKERMKLKFTIDDEVFKVSLGKTIFKEKIIYELEAEIKNAANLSQSAVRLKNWLQEKGMQQADVINDNFDQTIDGLNKLNQIQSL